jgi:hypothetical protein
MLAHAHTCRLLAAVCVHWSVGSVDAPHTAITAQVKELMNMGYDYARRVDGEGRLDPHFGIASRQETQPRQDYQAEPAAAAA